VELRAARTIHFVLLASHTPETCPSSNAKTRELVQKTAPEARNIAEKAGVKIVAGPFINHEHLVVIIAEAQKVEAIDTFLEHSRLGHWNNVRVLPSLTMEEGMQQLRDQSPIF
jgi:uncharacterized protein with GYD domain